MMRMFEQSNSSLSEEDKLREELDLCRELPRSYDTLPSYEFLRTNVIENQGLEIKIPYERVMAGNFYLCFDDLIKIRPSRTEDPLLLIKGYSIYIGGTPYYRCMLNNIKMMSKIIGDREIIYEDNHVKIPILWFDMFSQGLFPLYSLINHSINIFLDVFVFASYWIQYDTYTCSSSNSDSKIMLSDGSSSTYISSPCYYYSCTWVGGTYMMSKSESSAITVPILGLTKFIVIFTTSDHIEVEGTDIVFEIDTDMDLKTFVASFTPEITDIESLRKSFSEFDFNKGGKYCCGKGKDLNITSHSGDIDTVFMFTLNRWSLCAGMFGNIVAY